MTRIPMGGFNPSPKPQTLRGHARGLYVDGADRRKTYAGSFPFPASNRKNIPCKATGKRPAPIFSERKLFPLMPPKGLVVSKKTAASARDTVLDVMASLPPAFDANGTVTAATSSPITDGAAAVSGGQRGLCR